MYDAVYHTTLSGPGDTGTKVGDAAVGIAKFNPVVNTVLNITGGLVTRQDFFVMRNELTVKIIEAVTGLLGSDPKKMGDAWFKGLDNVPYSQEMVAMSYWISALNAQCIGDSPCSNDYLENKINRTGVGGYWKRAAEKLNVAQQIFWDQYWPRIDEKHNIEVLAKQTQEQQQQLYEQSQDKERKLAQIPVVGDMLAKYNALDSDGKTIVTITGALGGLVLLTATFKALKWI